MAKTRYEFDGYRINILTKTGERETAMFDSKSAALWCVKKYSHEWDRFNVRKVYRASNFN